MERAARRYAIKILFYHVAAFFILFGIVAYASREFYNNARNQALDQVRVRQELLASQAARGIESFYRSIVDDLDLQRRTETTATTQPLTPLIWEQLRGRAARVFEVKDRFLSNLVFESGDDQTPAAKVLERSKIAMLDLKSPTVVLSTMMGDADPTLVVLPFKTDVPRALVAVVPVRGVESRFLNDLNQPGNISSMLIANARVLSAEDRSLVGGSYAGNSAVAFMLLRHEKAGLRVTEEVRGFEAAGTRLKLDPSMVTLQPIDLPGGQRWWLAVSSRLASADQAVSQFFRRALAGAAIVILVMTTMLVSTAIQAIRGRVRLERLQHEMLNRELASARDIQLAWLPEKQGNTVCVDIAAINTPASHVSGDFYNWFELPDGRAVIVIGDVTGHGLPAAFLMATTQMLVRVTIDPHGDAGHAMRLVNRHLCSHVFSGQFVTMLIMVLDPKTNTLEIANAGHPPPLLGMTGAYEPLALKPELVLAVDDTVVYETQRFELPPGASLMLYTDGVTDVQSPTGDRLGIEGLAKSLFGRFDSAAAMGQAAADAINTFRAGREPNDDITLVALQLTCAPAPHESEPHPAEPARTA